MDPVEAEARRIIKADWSVAAKPSVVLANFSKEAVCYFRALIESAYVLAKIKIAPGIHEIMVRDLAWREVAADKKRLPGLLGTVGVYAWADVDADGTYELLMISDFSGRAFYRNLKIIKRADGIFRWQDKFIWNTMKISTIPDSQIGYGSMPAWNAGVVLSDMNHDGLLELIVPIGIGNHCTACASPIWPSVMKWEGGRYVEADQCFKGFYRDIVLPGIERRIAALERQGWPKGEFFDDLAAQQVLKDKLERFLGIDPRAGFERAVEWAHDQRLEPRPYALDEFGDIPGEESSRYLLAMAEDKKSPDSFDARRLFLNRIRADEIDRYSLEFLDGRIDEFMGRFGATKEGAIFLTQHSEKDLREVLKFLHDPWGFSGSALALPDLCAHPEALNAYANGLLPADDSSGLDSVFALVLKLSRTADPRNVDLLTTLLLRCEIWSIKWMMADTYTKLFEFSSGAMTKNLEQRANWKDIVSAASIGDKKAFFSGLAKLGDSPFERGLKAYAKSLKWRRD